LQGDQITPEVAHHAFHYWIRGYYSAAKPYLENKQQQRLTQWEWVPFLLEATHEIEVERNGQVKKLLDAPDVEKFLAEEMNVPDQKHVRRRS
jgi:hypothetical protein